MHVMEVCCKRKTQQQGEKEKKNEREVESTKEEQTQIATAFLDLTREKAR